MPAYANKRRAYRLTGIVLSLGCVAVGLLAAPDAEARVRPLRTVIERTLRSVRGLGSVQSLTRGLSRRSAALVRSVAARHGDEVAGRVAHYCRTFGRTAERALSANPAEAARVLDQLPADQAGKALRLISRDPAGMSRYVQQYGVDGMQLAMRHPRLGRSVAETYGREIMPIARDFSRKELRMLNRAAPAYKKMGPSAQARFRNMLKETPQKVWRTLDNYPNVTGTVVAGGSVLAEHQLSPDIVYVPVPENASTAEPAASSSAKEASEEAARTPVIALAGVLGAAAIGAPLLRRRLFPSYGNPSPPEGD
ncbi:MAG: hypothetical protein R6W89_08040 [Candidatus Hydrogenedentota bacterium]